MVTSKIYEESQKIVLARSSDSRVLKAANTLVDLDIGEVYLVRNANEDVLSSNTSTSNQNKGIEETRIQEEETRVELHPDIQWLDTRERCPSERVIRLPL